MEKLTVSEWAERHRDLPELPEFPVVQPYQSAVFEALQREGLLGIALVGAPAHRALEILLKMLQK